MYNVAEGCVGAGACARHLEVHIGLQYGRLLFVARMAGYQLRRLGVEKMAPVTIYFDSAYEISNYFGR